MAPVLSRNKPNHRDPEGTRAFGGGDPNDRYECRENLEGILLALAYLIVFSLFLLYPLLKELYMSLFDWNAICPSQSETTSG